MKHLLTKTSQLAMAVGFFVFNHANAADPQPVVVPGGLSSPEVAEQQLKAIQQAAKAASSAPAPEEIIPPPTTAGQTRIYGQFRSEEGVRIDLLFLNRYRESIVRVIAKDNSGNELSRSMGTAIGNPSGRVFIAAPLSGILGNNLQWADSIEIVHHKGNKYKANVALIDEQLDLVLLDPQNKPTPIVFIKPSDERAQIEVFAISFDTDPINPLKIQPNIHKIGMSAINKATGTLTFSSDKAEENGNEFAGTALITKNSEMIGVTLAGGQGILASTLTNAIERAGKGASISPRLVGVVMGRGVLVDPKLPGAFPSISAALDAIREGRAPKADPRLYYPAKTREFSPKEASRLVLKVMPGTYKEKQPLNLPSNLSLTGSGPSVTTILGSDPAKPLISIGGQNNISFSAFRIVPAALQNVDAPTVEIKNSQLIIALGNVIEAKGGSALHFEVTSNMAIFGNAFPQGKQKALVCKSSSTILEANAFLGAWPQAVALDTGCNAKIQRNVFLENQIALATSSQTESVEVRNNTFIKNLAAIRYFGDVPSGAYVDNIFYQNAYALFGSKDYSGKKIGRNSFFKSQVSFKGKSFKGLEMELAQPIFEIPDQYDFRLKSNSALIGAASTSDAEGNRLDFGAYQRLDCAGRWNGQLLTSIAAAVGEKKLATGCPSR